MISIIIPTHNRSTQLKNLIASIRESTYKNIEVIIINDGEDTLFKDKSDLTLVKIENKTNKGLAYSRTTGALHAKGKYILFIDDDNIIDKHMITYLAQTLDENETVIAVGPQTFYKSSPKIVWFLGVKMNLSTTMPRFFYEDTGNKEIVETDNLHNCFMVRKSIGNTVGWFDEKVFMGGTEYDFFQRVKQKFGSIILVTNKKAYCYHDIPLVKNDIIRSYGFESKKRVYYFQRNRGVLVGRHGNMIDKLSLFFIWYPFFFFYYSILFIYFHRYTFFITHIKATLVGYYYLVHKL